MPFWTLPLIVTVIAFWRALSGEAEGGWAGGLNTFVGLVVALIVSLIAWMIYFIAV